VLGQPAARFAQKLAAGKYTVSWRVKADDGDSEKGTFRFTVRQVRAPAVDARAGACRRPPARPARRRLGAPPARSEEFRSSPGT
jgi:CopC domain